ncbi:bifunctional oligoribonuclease/PAP phosphatase NrnA [PVC group bacterium]|nr:bifunctional oligoribonuclease/PAP phosphatase NrnA [PVC group bacterium]
MSPTKKILELIRQSRDVTITYHVNPDGDALGSALAMKDLVRSFKKKAVIIGSDKPSPRYNFLSGFNSIKFLSWGSSLKINTDLLIVLDSPEMDRIGHIRNNIIAKKIIKIDHHLSHEHFGDVNYVNAKAAATGELVFGVFSQGRIKLSRETARALYAAIATDTGFFSQENTRKETFEIISKLVAIGVLPDEMYRAICGERELKYFQLESQVRNTLVLHNKGRVASIEIKYPWNKKYDAANTDTNDFFASLKCLRGVQVMVLFWERKPKEIKMSLRSRKTFNVCRLAQIFGGGGHRLAAGCTIKGSLSHVKQKLLSQIKLR